VRPRAAIAALAAVLVVAGVFAQGGATCAADRGRVPQPDIARGQGEACVADTGFMRREHMTVLDHQRDETVQEGIRGKRFSLRECVACHAVAGPDGVAVGADDPRFFCTGCHEYVAVRIDCFECHAARPEERDEARANSHPGTASLMGIQWQ
jgi:predicted CXXCH cytochrome family protein